jgi:predicted transcriptional regulator
MPRPNASEQTRLRKTMETHIKSGLSTGQIARLMGKSQQAVHQYLVAHGLKTQGMIARAKNNLDNAQGSSEIEGTN